MFRVDDGALAGGIVTVQVVDVVRGPVYRPIAREKGSCGLADMICTVIVDQLLDCWFGAGVFSR